MSDKSLIYHTEKGIAWITLNRPGARNALDAGLAGEIADVCREIRRDNEVRVVVLTGDGDAFCAGGGQEVDINKNAVDAVASIEQPVIAAVNGEAVGWGLELVLSCDIRLASATALFSMPQVRAGLLPAGGGTQRLPRIVGRSKALELLFTGAAIDANEALAIGMVSEVVAANSLMEEARKLAEEMANNAPAALRFAKEAVNKGMDMSLEQGLRLEADLYFLLHTTGDRAEGIKAFLDKRAPHFKGE